MIYPSLSTKISIIIITSAYIHGQVKYRRIKRKKEHTDHLYISNLLLGRHENKDGKSLFIQKKVVAGGKKSSRNGGWLKLINL